MPRIRLPIERAMNANALSGTEYQYFDADYVNCYVDEFGHIRRMWGYDEFCDSSEGAEAVDGIYWWDRQNMLIFVCNGKTFKVTGSDGSGLAQIAGDTFTADKRVIFADFGTALYAANTGTIKALTTTTSTAIADADAPTQVSHVAALNRKLIANQLNSGNIHWSDAGAPTSWSAYYIEAEYNPDYATAIASANASLYAIGDYSLQKFYDDSGLLRTLPQAAVSSGAIAPYSFIYIPMMNSFYWVDQECNFVRLSGNGVEILNPSLTNYFKTYNPSSLVNAVADFIQLGGRPFYTLRWGTDTILYDLIANNWTRINSYTAPNFGRWPGNCYAYSQLWGFWLMGGYNDGKIYKVMPNYYDMDSASLRMQIVTPVYDHGDPSKKKYSNALHIRCKRTEYTASTSAPTIQVSYKDENDTAFSTARTITLHPLNQTEFMAYTTRLGSYYSRQWKIVYSDAYPLAIASVHEDVEIEG